MDHGEDRRQVALPGPHEKQPVDEAVGSQPWHCHPDTDGRHLELVWGRGLGSYIGRGMALPPATDSWANKDRNLRLYLTSGAP